MSIILANICMWDKFLTLTIVGKYPDGDAPTRPQAFASKRVASSIVDWIVDGFGSIKVAGRIVGRTRHLGDAVFVR